MKQKITVENPVLFLGFPTVWIHLPGHFKGFGGGHVSVGRCDCQDDTVRVGDMLQDQISYLDLDVFGLITHRHLEGNRKMLASARLTGRSKARLLREPERRLVYLGDSWQIHQREVDNMRGEDLQVNGVVADSLQRNRKSAQLSFSRESLYPPLLYLQFRNNFQERTCILVFQ